MKSKFNLPNGGKVVDEPWQDDIDLNFETYGTNKQEMEYISPSDVPKESIEKIKAINLKLRERGQKVGKILLPESI